jgi:hypothetical protein
VPWVEDEIAAETVGRARAPQSGVLCDHGVDIYIYIKIHIYEDPKSLKPACSVYQSLLYKSPRSLTMNSSYILVLAWALCCSAAALPTCGVCCPHRSEEVHD